MRLKTPKEGVSLVMMTFLLYLVLPVLKAVSLCIDLGHGKFPVQSDSIGLGWAQFVFALILSVPLVAGFVLWIVWKYTPEAPLLGYNRERPFWSYVWTLIFGFLFLDSLAFGIVKTMEGNFAETIETILTCYFFLLYRASIVFRKGEIR